MEADREVSVAGVWRLLVRVLAPADERDAIVDDLDEEARQLSGTHGAGAARRFIWWHVLHSIPHWLDRRTRHVAAATRRNVMMLHRGLWSDIRLAARRLGQSRGFTALSVLTLAVGIGAVSTIFSLAYALWLKPVPWFEPDRVVWIQTRHEGTGAAGSLTARELAGYQRDAQSFSGVAGFSYGAVIARVHDEPVRVVSYPVSPNLFRVLGVRPALGRDFSDEDGVGARLVMLSHSFWMRRFGGDPNILGQVLATSGESYEVVGVMPRGFSFPRTLAADVWMPLDFAAQVTQPDRRSIQVVARLALGHTVDGASTEADVMAARFAQAFPDASADWAGSITAAGVTTSRSRRLVFQALLGMVVLFLVISCTNLAGLLLARNAARRTELAVCVSLGASWWRLARGLLVETVLLAGAGCLAGLALSSYAARVLASTLPRNTPGLDDVTINLPVVALAIGVSLVSAVCIGLLPAFGLRSMKPSEALSTTRSVTRATSRAQGALVVAELILAMVLVVGAAAMVRSLTEVLRADRGYEPAGLQALNVSLPFGDDAFESTARRAAAFNDILARVAAVPGVRAVGATTGFPGSALGVIGGAFLTPAPGQTPTLAAVHAASAEYFTTMRMPLRAGRVFTHADTTAAPAVAIVNELLAAQFPGGNPVGHRIPLSFFGGQETPFEIVGVVGNIRLTDQVNARVFVPLPQVSPYWIDVVYRQAPGSNASALVRPALRAMNAELLIENESSFQSIINNSLSLERTQSVFAGLVGLLSTLVAGVGLYALMTFLSAQRRREFGIRLALGSQPWQLCRWAITGPLRLVVAGLVCGAAAASLLARLLGSQVFGLATVGPATYLLAGGVLCLVALVAAWFPTRRVLRTDPLAALRSEQ